MTKPPRKLPVPPIIRKVLDARQTAALQRLAKRFVAPTKAEKERAERGIKAIDRAITARPAVIVVDRGAKPTAAARAAPVLDRGRPRIKVTRIAVRTELKRRRRAGEEATQKALARHFHCSRQTIARRLNKTGPKLSK